MSDRNKARHDETGAAPEEASRERRSYIVGFAVSLALTLPPFAMVAFDLAARPVILWTLAVAGLVQIVAHFRWFLHIRLRGQSSEDLQLILFTSLILGLMAGGTIWLLSNMASRM